MGSAEMRQALSLLSVTHQRPQSESVNYRLAFFSLWVITLFAFPEQGK